MRITKVQISLSLISTFVIRFLDSIIPLVSISEISSLYLACCCADAGLSLTWSQTPKTGFLVMWLICHLLIDLWVRSMSWVHWPQTSRHTFNYMVNSMVFDKIKVCGWWVMMEIEIYWWSVLFRGMIDHQILVWFNTKKKKKKRKKESHLIYHHSIQTKWLPVMFSNTHVPCTATDISCSHLFILKLLNLMNVQEIERSMNIQSIMFKHNIINFCLHPLVF